MKRRSSEKAPLTSEKARSVDHALRVETLFKNAPHPISRLIERCGRRPLQVLGRVNPSQPPSQFNPVSIVAYTDPSRKFPRLYCPDEAHLAVQIIIFDRPHPTRMQYFSLSPISLALEDKPTNVSRSQPPFESIDAAEEEERRRKKVLTEKLRLHSVIDRPSTEKETSLPWIIEQANCSHELAVLLQSNIGLVGTRMKRTLSVGERVVEHAMDLWDYLSMALWHVTIIWIYPVLVQIFILGLIAHRMAGEVLLKLLDWRVSPDAAALKDISATAQQVDIRLQQFCYWPIQYLTLRRRKRDWESITTSHPEYIRFYNSLWLVANDVIIGIALGSYIIENADFVASQVDTVFNTWSIEGLRRTVSWLKLSPGGLKLNQDLANFLGDLFLWVIDYWAGMTLTCCLDYLADSSKDVWPR